MNDVSQRLANLSPEKLQLLERRLGSSQEIGQHPSRAVVTLDNSRLYVSNFGSNSIAVYDIDLGRIDLALTILEQAAEIGLWKGGVGSDARPTTLVAAETKVVSERFISRSRNVRVLVKILSWIKAVPR